MIKRCLVTKHVDVVQSGQTASNMFERAGCFAVFEEMIDVVQGLSNTIQHDQTRCPNRENRKYHQTSGSCLIAEHLSFGQGFKLQQKQHFADC